MAHPLHQPGLGLCGLWEETVRWWGTNPEVQVECPALWQPTVSIAGCFLRDWPTRGDLPGGPCREGAAGQHYTLCRTVYEKLGPGEGIGWGHESTCLVMLSAAVEGSVVWNMGCFCCSLAAFWQILFSLWCCYSCCSQTVISWAGLGELIPSPGRRQRIFRKSKQLGQGDLSPLQFKKAKPDLAVKKWDTSSSEKGAALLHSASHSVLNWSQLTPAGKSHVLVAAKHGLHPLFCSPCLSLAPRREPWS